MFSIPVFVRVARRGEPPQTRAELTVLGWSGMRGGVSLGRACPSAHRGAHLDRLAGEVYEYCSTRMRGTSAWRAGPDSRVQIGDLLSNVLDSRSDKKGVRAPVLLCLLLAVARPGLHVPDRGTERR
jgi:hypothetical protein